MSEPQRPCFTTFVIPIIPDADNGALARRLSEDVTALGFFVSHIQIGREDFALHVEGPEDAKDLKALAPEEAGLVTTLIRKHFGCGPRRIHPLPFGASMQGAMSLRQASSTSRATHAMPFSMATGWSSARSLKASRPRSWERRRPTLPKTSARVEAGNTTSPGSMDSPTGWRR